MKLFSFLFIFLAVTSQAFATLQDDFEALRNTPRDYVDTGAICEEVARLQIAKTYQEPQYTVVTGIAYGNKAQVIGELDVIIFDNNTKKAARIGEVKCWKKLDQGLRKARNQRQRFLTTQQEGRITFVRSTAGNGNYSVDQFAYVQDFISIAQKGSKAHGYDQELEYSLEDLMTLRQMMIDCQNKGECAKK